MEPPRRKAATLDRRHHRVNHDVDRAFDERAHYTSNQLIGITP
ncbi:MAG: hypothetical protein OXU77_08810 [Gammaproteobacteria bacterium]|nr:hypothetical protein [Gammaproteobacteria bacterium]MDE0441555.1 hypothetical protein [Gammaproteobacteria bacterium]